MIEIPDNAWAYAAFFLIGLSFNLTPCVYPLIALTVSLLKSRKGNQPAVAFLKSLFFISGISVTFSCLGVGAAYAGEALAGFLQTSWVYGAIAVLFLVLALNMLGLYELQFPSWILNKLGSRQKPTLFGIFFSGLIVAFFAAPCIGAPVAALLTFVGSRQDPLFAGLAFFSMALGLGLPYLILGTCVGLLERLPRAGSWLNWTEKIFGMILLAFSIVYGVMAYKPEALPLGMTAALVVAAVYFAWIEKLGNEHAVVYWSKKACAVMLIVAAVAVYRPYSGFELEWESYSAEKLEDARLHHQPAVIDFYADWCVPCHELDRVTFSHPEVAAVLQTLRRFKADLTEPSSEMLRSIMEKYDVIGVPTVLFVDREGETMEGFRISGFIPPKEMLAIFKDPGFQERMINRDVNTD
ncbi:MAG: thioredoxin family protein [Candidatus Omnitrophica bacterium]|nr:thioredoxin family protein [Candidatus Omnitrophota bacterium]